MTTGRVMVVSVFQRWLFHLRAAFNPTAKTQNPCWAERHHGGGGRTKDPFPASLRYVRYPQSSQRTIQHSTQLTGTWRTSLWSCKHQVAHPTLLTSCFPTRLGGASHAYGKETKPRCCVSRSQSDAFFADREHPALSWGELARTQQVNS